MREITEIENEITSTKARLAALERELAETRKSAIKKGKDQIREIMMVHGISVSDLSEIMTPRKAAGKNGETSKSAPKYRSSDGQTWSGRGQPPAWIRDVPKHEWATKFGIAAPGGSDDKPAHPAPATDN